MIGYLHGTVSHLFPESCFINVQGVGYRVYIPGSTRQKLSLGMETTLFTYLHVREDAMLLYGFISQEEYELFLKMTSVSGIGPKVALGVLSAIQPNAFCRAVSQKNSAVLTKLPGIGKKTAERIILELKDKIGFAAEADETESTPGISVDPSGGALQDAVLALTALGYNQAEIMPVLKRLAVNELPVEDLVKQALKEFMRR